jgi:5'-methylthioadenosine phosphorylase
MPSEVNYRANVFALKSLGVEQVTSISVCGSLREYLHPGEIVVPDQLFDFTKRRAYTFFGGVLVAHRGEVSGLGLRPQVSSSRLQVWGSHKLRMGVDVGGQHHDRG